MGSHWSRHDGCDCLNCAADLTKKNLTTSFHPDLMAMHETLEEKVQQMAQNEVNMDDNWPAEKYAQWLYDLAIEAEKAYPGLKICSCGMAGSGAGYYDEMLKFKPELKEVVDFWGLHPYGANHPPEYKPQGCSLRCYEETKAMLAKYGIAPIRLMCTETG